MRPSTTAPLRRQAEKHHAINARQQTGKICVDQIVAATPSLVFQAWLDPNLAGRWLFATATRPMTEVSITPRAGGRFRLADGEVFHTGRYILVEDPHKLAFWLDDTNSRVSIEFAPRNNGCLLRLEHHNLPPELSAHARERWLGMLYGLSLLLDQARSKSITAGNPPARLRRAGPL